MTQDMREQKTKAKVKKTTTIRSCPRRSPHAHPLINQPRPPPPIIYNNNRMGIEFVVQMRQSNKYGSVRND